ncbi:hypothetical protein DD238_003015 [Peronospora effusa]|uniref:Ribosome biogenesis protein WDR12 homolog n=1 Tax=Peronospora effusa TaxID=542832 RepID=A0A3M6VQT2_9STRA|nr:hypothetical protein DD238_003015 [Peronospora effusa]
MFAASWKVVDLFAGMQIWQEQAQDVDNHHSSTNIEPLNNVLLTTTSAGLVTFLAGHIGGGGFLISVILTGLVVAAALWTLSNARAKKAVPCFKTLQVVDGSPSEIFLYLMGIKNYPVWDASVEKAEVSALHPECPPMHGLVRATCKGGGFVISPRTLSLTQGDEMTSMVTNVVHLDPQGWEGKLLQRLNVMHLYVRPQVLSLTGLRDVMEARKYVCPNVPEEFSAALAASTEEQKINAAVQDGKVIRGAAGDVNPLVSRLEEFPSNVPRSMWAEPDGATMMVRGPDYLIDRRKIPSQSPYFRLVGVDLFESSEAVEHIASRSDNPVQRELRRHEELGTEMPFTFVVNFVVPGTPRINLVLYYQVPHPSVLTDGSPSSELMADFLEGSDEFRNERFKLIPCIVEGSFIVRQAVGSTPALVGKKLRQPTFRGKQYFELDVDIGSSAVANRVVGLVSGYTKKLVIDMGFVLESQSSDELPERLLGSVRLIRVKFVTKDVSIRVTETPFAVPTRLNRRGLSQIVNHLLDTNDKLQPFDFLIDGLFLRSSLDKYLQLNNVSEETLLTLEYVQALPEPQKQNDKEHPDWVSAVAALEDDLVVTGCYDGLLRIYDAQGDCKASVKAHQGAIKAVSVSGTKGEFVISSSGKDQLAQLWRYTASSAKLSPLAALTGHLNSVDAVQMHASGKRVVTGSWDNTVRVWQTPPRNEEEGNEQRSAKKHKKTENGAGTVSFQQLEAEIVLVGHTSYVTSVAFRPKNSEHDEDVVVSAGSDRTVRLWDLVTQSCSQSLVGNRAVSDLSVNANGLVLTAHPDQCVRLWDPRAQQSGESIVQRTFRSHKQWVSSVAWHPDSSANEHMFVSGDYDGMAKLWDARSTIPLHTVKAHEGKLLDLSWRNQGNNESNVVFVTGGDDKKLNFFSV